MQPFPGCGKSRSLLAQEFRRVLQEVKIGKPRKENNEKHGRTAKSRRSFKLYGTVVQADQLGISMANMLRLQAQVIQKGAKG